MSTEIGTIKGTCHKHLSGFEIDHVDADISLTRFYNGKELGTGMQVTISANNEYGTSYIHLNEDQCKELAQMLIDAWDYNKHPSR